MWLSTDYIFVVACSQVHCRFPKAEEIAYSSLSPQSMAQSLAQCELWLLSKEDGRQDSQVEDGPGSLSGKESGCGLVEVKKEECGQRDSLEAHFNNLSNRHLKRAVLVETGKRE